MQYRMVVAHKEPSPIPVKRTEAVSSNSSTVIVFDISAMNQTTIAAVKSALRQKAEEMIQNVVMPCDGLDELTQHGQDALKSLQSSHVTVEIGTPAVGYDFIHCVSKKCTTQPTTNDNFDNSCPIPVICGTNITE